MSPVITLMIEFATLSNRLARTQAPGLEGLIVTGRVVENDRIVEDQVGHVSAPRSGVGG